MRKVWAVLLLWFHTISTFGQQPRAEIPPAAAAPLGVSAQAVDVVDASVDAYFREKVARAKPGVVVKGMHRTPAPGVFVVQLQNDWLTYAFRVRSSAGLVDAAQTPAIGADALDAAVRTFVGLDLIKKDHIVATLRTLGVKLDDVYRPATAPHFNNGRGLVFHRKERRFLLVARGVRDLAANACFKAAIDVSTGNLLSNAEVPCFVE